MTIIDRYLLRQFMRTFLICFVSLTGLYVVIDAFTNLEDFLRYADECGGLLPILGHFYLFKSIWFFDRAAALLMLVAAMFPIAWMQRHNEMTALQAAGISRIRIATPVIAAAIGVAVLAAANRELLLPRFRKELARRAQDLTGDVGQPLTPHLDNQTDVILGGKRTFADRQRIEKPKFLLPHDLRDYGLQVAAENAFYRPPQGTRPGGYLLVDVKQPGDLGERPSLRLGESPVVITPRDADWLKPNQCFVVSGVSFEQLAAGDAFRRFSSWRQLVVGLRNPSLSFGADMRVAVHARPVQPLLDVTLLFLGLPLIVSRDHRNVFVATGLCMGVVSVFMLVVMGCHQLGTSLVLDPALAAWVPLMLFVPAAVWMAESMWR